MREGTRDTHDFFGRRMAVAESSTFCSLDGSLAMVVWWWSGFEGEWRVGVGERFELRVRVSACGCVWLVE